MKKQELNLNEKINNKLRELEVEIREEAFSKIKMIIEIRNKLSKLI